jgi:phosphoglycolate phosphatase
MRPTILLFDIDGTLVSTGGAGRAAIERAFAELEGGREACAHFSFAGMTDRAIARSGLQAIGREPSEAAIAQLLARYVDLLDAAIAESPRFRVLPGVHALLDAAEARAGVAVGLGTGNVARGAEKKLTYCDLWRRFPFGGFADDSEERPRLIRAGAERGAQRLGVALERCRVVVIGDTPKDVAAAAANGFESLAVASGQHPLEELVACGATLAVATLEDARVAAAALNGAPAPRS